MKAILAAGGTAGHINPAISIASEITAHGGEVLFIGNETSMEKELVPKAGFDIKCIKVSGFQRKLTLENIKTAYRAADGLVKTKKIIKEYKPDIVIGCGGYVSGPAVYSAASMKIPTLIHEQNAFPGLTNKILSKVVDTVCISFDGSEKYFKTNKKIVFTGNPVRKNILDVSYEEARKKLNITKPCVLVFGGSLGAQKINDVMTGYVKNADDNIHIIWGTGKRYYEDVMKNINADKLPENIEILPYIYDMDTAMSASDIVVSRAGAITLSEICAKGKAAVLVPSPYVANNHQEYNARALEKKGAAIMMSDGDITPDKFRKTIIELAADRAKLESMKKCALKMSTANAAELIYNEIEKLLKIN